MSEIGPRVLESLLCIHSPPNHSLMAMGACQSLPADSCCGFTLEIFSPSGHAAWQRTSEELWVKYLEQFSESPGPALQGTGSQDNTYGLLVAQQESPESCLTYMANFLECKRKFHLAIISNEPSFSMKASTKSIPQIKQINPNVPYFNHIPSNNIFYILQRRAN